MRAPSQYDPIITNDVLYQLSYSGPVEAANSTANRRGKDLFFGCFRLFRFSVFIDQFRIDDIFVRLVFIDF